MISGPEQLWQIKNCTMLSSFADDRIVLKGHKKFWFISLSQFGYVFRHHLLINQLARYIVVLIAEACVTWSWR